MDWSLVLNERVDWAVRDTWTTNCLVKHRLFKTLTELRKGQNVNHETTFGFVDGPYDLFKKEVQSINIWYRYFAVFSLEPFFNKSLLHKSLSGHFLSQIIFCSAGCLSGLTFKSFKIFTSTEETGNLHGKKK